MIPKKLQNPKKDATILFRKNFFKINYLKGEKMKEPLKKWTAIVPEINDISELIWIKKFPEKKDPYCSTPCFAINLGADRNNTIQTKFITTIINSVYCIKKDQVLSIEEMIGQNFYIRNFCPKPMPETLEELEEKMSNNPGVSEYGKLKKITKIPIQNTSSFYRKRFKVILLIAEFKIKGKSREALLCDIDIADPKKLNSDIFRKRILAENNNYSGSKIMAIEPLEI